MQLRNLIVPVAVVALGVAACGGDDSSGDEAPDNGDAAGDESSADESDTEDTEDTEESSEDDAESAGSGDEVDEAALFEAMANAYIEAGSFEFESTITEGGQEATVTGEIETSSEGRHTAMRLAMDQAGEQTTMLLVDGQFYVEITESMGIPGGEGWLTFGSDGEGQIGEQMTGAFDEIGSAADVSARLSDNADAVTVTEVGSATVDGVETTEYHVVVNDIAAYTGTDGDLGVSEMSQTIWIDGDNLPRRMVEESDGGVPVEILYRNFGVDVDIEAPPEDEVVDFSDMMNQ